MVVHSDQHQISRLAANLKTEASSLHLDEGRRAPAAMARPAGYQALSVFAAKDECAFFKGRHDHDAGRFRRDIEWNPLVWGIHQLMKHSMGGLDAALQPGPILPSS